MNEIKGINRKKNLERFFKDLFIYVKQQIYKTKTRYFLEFYFNMTVNGKELFDVTLNTYKYILNLKNCMHIYI